MSVKIVPLPALTGLKFDMILPDGYIVTITMEEYEVRMYRGAIIDVIHAKVVDWMEQNDYSIDNLEIVIL